MQFLRSPRGKQLFTLRNLLLTLLLLAIAVPLLAMARQQKSGKAKPAQEPPQITESSQKVAPAAKKTYQIDGFRSALFGMNEKEVRAVIVKDLGVEDKAIKSITTPKTKNKILFADVPKLDIEAGPARVSYIFGYSSNKLVRVETSWGNALIPASTASFKDLTTAGRDLVNYFGRYRFKEGSVVTDQQLPRGGKLLFKAEDDSNHALNLTFVVYPEKAGGELNKEDPGKNRRLMTLSYIDRANVTDVFRIDPGQF